MTPLSPSLFVSSADAAEPLSDLSHDFVDLERLQKSRFLFQFHSPSNQNLIRSLFLVIAFINNLLDGHFPFMKTHRLFLLDFGGGGCVLEKKGIDIIFLDLGKNESTKRDCIEKPNTFLFPLIPKVSELDCNQQ